GGLWERAWAAAWVGDRRPEANAGTPPARGSHLPSRRVQKGNRLRSMNPLARLSRISFRAREEIEVALAAPRSSFNMRSERDLKELGGIECRRPMELGRTDQSQSFLDADP